MVLLLPLAAGTPMLLADPLLHYSGDQSVVSEQSAATLIVSSVQTPEQQVAALYDASGLKQLVETIPASTVASFEEAITADTLPLLFDAVPTSEITQALVDAFQVETFRSNLFREFHRAMTEDNRSRLLEWYDSPMGKRVSQAEVDNSLLTAGDRFYAYQQHLMNHAPDAEREQLIYSIDNTMRTTRSAVDMMTNIQVAFNLSMARFIPEQERYSSAEIIESIRSEEALLLTQYRNQTREVLLFTYQDFDNSELKAIDTFFASHAGQAFIKAVNKGISHGMFDASIQLGESLGGHLHGAESNAHQGPGI